MATRRQEIVLAIVDLLKQIDGTGTYKSNLNGNVRARQVFWDEVTDFPTVCVSNGTETRDYKPGDFKWAFLDMRISIYVEHEDPKDQLERIFGDIEKVLDANNNLTVGGNSLCTDLRILSISDDEGVLAPLGIGEILFNIQYSA